MIGSFTDFQKLQESHASTLEFRIKLTQTSEKPSELEEVYFYSSFVKHLRGHFSIIVDGDTSELFLKSMMRELALQPTYNAEMHFFMLSMVGDAKQFIQASLREDVKVRAAIKDDT